MSAYSRIFGYGQGYGKVLWGSMNRCIKTYRIKNNNNEKQKCLTSNVKMCVV